MKKDFRPSFRELFRKGASGLKKGAGALKKGTPAHKKQCF